MTMRILEKKDHYRKCFFTHQKNKSNILFIPETSVYHYRAHLVNAQKFNYYFHLKKNYFKRLA